MIKIAGVGKVIMVASGKGGVGKSTIATNIATCLSMRGYKTGIVDLDIHGSSIPTMFGISKQPDIDENGLMLPIIAHNVAVQSLGLMVGEAVPIIWRGAMVSKAITQLIGGTNYEGLDYLIIDTPPGTGDTHLSLMKKYHIDGVVMVTTPQDIAMLDVRRLHAMCDKISVPILGLIANMSYYLDDNGVKQYLFGKLNNHNMTILGEIPIFPKIASNSDIGTPIILEDKKISAIFNEILDKIIASSTS